MNTAIVHQGNRAIIETVLRLKDNGLEEMALLILLTYPTRDPKQIFRQVSFTIPAFSSTPSLVIMHL